MDEYLLHEEYYKSVRGKDGEEPLEALGSPPHTDMGSFLYSGPPTDLADTVSLPRRPRGPAWRPELPTTSRNREVCPAYLEDSHLPGRTDGALDRTADLLAKLLYGSEDPDVTDLSEAVKAKKGITEPLPKPALASSSPGWSTPADDLKRSRVSRLLPKVTCPSPFRPRARTVRIAELQDVPVTEIEKKGLTALAPLAGVPPPPFRPKPRGWEEWQTNCPGEHPAGVAGVRPEKPARMARINLIHGTQVDPPFTTTLVGVSGIFMPFPFATFRGRGATLTQVSLERNFSIWESFSLSRASSMSRSTRSSYVWVLLFLCAYTEVCFIDRESFLRSLENLGPGRTGFYNLLHLFLQKFLFAWAFQKRTFSGHIHMRLAGKQKKLGKFL